MLRRIDLMALPFYRKEPLTGSLNGMRYRIALKKAEEPENETLQVVLYPDEWSFENTDEALKQYYEFPYSEEGLVQITDFLNEQAETQKELWKL